jgi:hypothetical protein
VEIEVCFPNHPELRLKNETLSHKVEQEKFQTATQPFSETTINSL